MVTSVTSPLTEPRGIRLENHGETTRYLVPIGRVLIALIFLVSVPSHFTQATFDHATAQGLPAANVLVPLAGLLELVGAVSLVLGYRARIGALLLALFLIPVTLVMHRFWGIADPMQAQIQQLMFLKNVAILGAALAFMHFGAGPYSFDARSGR